MLKLWILFFCLRLTIIFYIFSFPHWFFLYILLPLISLIVLNLDPIYCIKRYITVQYWQNPNWHIWTVRSYLIEWSWMHCSAVNLSPQNPISILCIAFAKMVWFWQIHHELYLGLLKPWIQNIDINRRVAEGWR